MIAAIIEKNRHILQNKRRLVILKEATSILDQVLQQQNRRCQFSLLRKCYSRYLYKGSFQFYIKAASINWSIKYKMNNYTVLYHYHYYRLTFDEWLIGLKAEEEVGGANVEYLRWIFTHTCSITEQISPPQFSLIYRLAETTLFPLSFYSLSVNACFNPITAIHLSNQ